MSRMTSRLTLMRWFVLAAWRAQRGRWLTAAAAVAIGIALATAIFTVNRSALAEFQQAIDTVNGEATMQITARAGTFPDDVFDAVLRQSARAGIEAASPVVSIDVIVKNQPNLPPERPRERLTVLGIDVFRAGAATPALIPQVDTTAGESGGAGASLFADDAIFLSPAAQTAYGVKPGDRIAVTSGLLAATLRIAGSVSAAPGQRLAIMDIGAAQWRLGAMHKLSRIDLRLAEGTTPDSAAALIAPLLPATVEIAPPEKRTQRMSNLSRAYRVNLNVLALVALFTGAFLVFSAVALSAVRQRPQRALMSVLGADNAWVRNAVLAQGLAVSVAGSVAGSTVSLAISAARNSGVNEACLRRTAPAAFSSIPALAI